MSADDNAPEQAREVEVVEDVLRQWLPITAWVDARKIAAKILGDIEPVRAAERQEAAREAWDDGYFHGWDDESFEERGKTPNPYRADGVTGRSGT